MYGIISHSRMKLHVPSFSAGLGLGIVFLLVVFGIQSLMGNESADAPAVGGQFPATVRHERLQTMADRFGMTPEELQAQLDAGKTMQEIAEEKDVELPLRRGPGSVASGSGAETAESRASSAS